MHNTRWSIELQVPCRSRKSNRFAGRGWASCTGHKIRRQSFAAEEQSERSSKKKKVTTLTLVRERMSGRSECFRKYAEVVCSFIRVSSSTTR